MDKAYKSKTWLYVRWVVQRKSVKEMAEESNCSEETIHHYLNKEGLKETRKK